VAVADAVADAAEDASDDAEDGDAMLFSRRPFGVGSGGGSDQRFAVGDRAYTCFSVLGRAAWFGGNVSAVHPDGRVDVEYDDGDRRSRVNPSEIARSPPAGSFAPSEEQMLAMTGFASNADMATRGGGSSRLRRGGRSSSSSRTRSTDMDEIVDRIRSFAARTGITEWPEWHEREAEIMMGLESMRDRDPAEVREVVERHLHELQYAMQMWHEGEGEGGDGEEYDEEATYAFEAGLSAAYGAVDVAAGGRRLVAADGALSDFDTTPFDPSVDGDAVHDDGRDDETSAENAYILGQSHSFPVIARSVDARSLLGSAGNGGGESAVARAMRELERRRMGGHRGRRSEGGEPGPAAPLLRLDSDELQKLRSPPRSSTPDGRGRDRARSGSLGAAAEVRSFFDAMTGGSTRTPARDDAVGSGIRRADSEHMAMSPSDNPPELRHTVSETMTSQRASSELSGLFARLSAKLPGFGSADAGGAGASDAATRVDEDDGRAAAGGAGGRAARSHRDDRSGGFDLWLSANERGAKKLLRQDLREQTIAQVLRASGQLSAGMPVHNRVFSIIFGTQPVFVADAAAEATAVAKREVTGRVPVLLTRAARAVAAADAASRATWSSSVSDGEGGGGDAGGEASLVEILQLLSVLRVGCGAVTGSAGTLVPALLPAAAWSNATLTRTFLAAVRDPLAVVSGALPDWCRAAATSFRFLLPLHARMEYFELTAFGVDHALAYSKARVASALDANVGGSPSRPRRRDESRVPKQKVVVSRERVLESAMVLMDQIHRLKNIELSIDFSKEPGHGLGPTLEFFTLVCRELQRRDLGLWRDDPSAGAMAVLVDDTTSLFVAGGAGGDGVDGGKYVHAQNGLFPAAIPASVSDARRDTVLSLFEFCGRFVAKALADGRLLDLPFAVPFCRRLLGEPAMLSDVILVDPEFGKSLLAMQELCERKRAIESDASLSAADLEARLAPLREEVDAYMIDFTHADGDDMVELKPGGADELVTIDTLGEFLELCTHHILVDSIGAQVERFCEGFAAIAPISSLKVFSAVELSDVLSGGSDLREGAWNADSILPHIVCDHGYQKTSPQVQQLVSIMSEFTTQERRLFLRFVTGAPRLPMGGFASLRPPLTIVKTVPPPGRIADEMMPTCMVCSVYLKLPAYTEPVVLRDKLHMAIRDGQESFEMD